MTGCLLLLLARFASAAEPGTGTTRVSLVWLFGDDDLFRSPAATSPPSPGPSFGDRPGYDAVSDGVSSRFTGRENRLELRLAAHEPGLLTQVSTRAELALGLDMSALGERPATFVLEDEGSFLEVELALSAAERDPDSARIRLYPLYGDAVRVGHVEALAWGGAVGPARESPYGAARGAVRAAEVSLEVGNVRSFVALKTAPFLEPTASGPSVEKTNYGWAAGLGVRPVARFGFELGFGHFEHGRLASGGSAASRATTTGGSARLVFGTAGAEPRPPVAFGSEASPFDARPASSSGRGAWAVAVEGAHLVQRLASFERPASSRLVGARALAVSSWFELGVFEARGALLARDAPFVMRSAPGIMTGFSPPERSTTAPELTALASVHVRLHPVLSGSFAAGVRRPAQLTAGAFDRFGHPLGATLVLHGAGRAEPLPLGRDAAPIVDVRPGLELRLSRLLSAAGWLGYRRDPNRARLVATREGFATRGFLDPHRASFGLLARAVW